MVKCTSCGANISYTDVYCPNCGTRAQQSQIPMPPGKPAAKCGKCGAAIASGTAFCSECGANVAPPQQSPHWSESSPQTGSRPRPRSSNNGANPLLIAAAVVIGLVILVAALASLGSHDQNQLRFYQLGDEWTYSVTGQISNAAGRSLDITSGTVTDDVGKVTTDSGTRYFRQDTTISLAISGVSNPLSISESETYKQDPSSFSTYLVSDTNGENHTMRTVTGQYQVDTPGEFSASTQSDNQITFDNGDSKHILSKVTGATPTSVSTPVGSLTGWSSHQEEEEYHRTSGDGSWALDGVFVPGIGNYATGDETVTLGDGMIVKIHLVLTSTNVH